MMEERDEIIDVLHTYFEVSALIEKWERESRVGDLIDEIRSRLDELEELTFKGD